MGAVKQKEACLFIWKRKMGLHCGVDWEVVGFNKEKYFQDCFWSWLGRHSTGEEQQSRKTNPACMVQDYVLVGGDNGRWREKMLPGEGMFEILIHRVRVWVLLRIVTGMFEEIHMTVISRLNGDVWVYECRQLHWWIQTFCRQTHQEDLLSLLKTNK